LAGALGSYSVDTAYFERLSQVPQSDELGASAVVVFEMGATPLPQEINSQHGSILLRVPLVVLWRASVAGLAELKAIFRLRAPDGILVPGLNDSARQIYDELSSAVRGALGNGFVRALLEQLPRLPQSIHSGIIELVAHPSEVGDVSDLAVHSMMSRRSLNRSYASLGLSPRRLIRAARLAVALDLLRGGRPMGEALKISGIAEAQQFRRYLTMVFGTSCLSELLVSPIDVSVTHLVASCFDLNARTASGCSE
jgi:AraC-like DNA-binding protein